MLLLAALPLCAESIGFRQALDLALKHSGVMVAAAPTAPAPYSAIAPSATPTFPP